MAGFTAADVPRLKREVGVRFSRRAQRRRAADHGRRPRVRRHAERRGLCAQRRDRLRALDVSGRRRGARGGHASAASTRDPDRASPRSSAIAPATSTRSMRPPARCCGRRRSTTFRSRASPARRRSTTAGSTSASRPAKRRPAPSADYECCKFRGSLVALERRERASRSGRPTRSEEPQADDEEQGRHAVVGAVGRADLVEPGDRHRAERRLRHDRQQLQRSGDEHERRVRGVRPRLRARCCGRAR